MALYPIVAAVGGISLENHCILFFSDNQAVVEIINKSSSKDPNIMIHVRCLTLTFNFGHKCTTNESNANHLKSIFNKVI